MRSVGYDVRLVDSTEYLPSPLTFPQLDRAWKRNDVQLIRFYDALAPALDWCDIFVHYNGANIHPRWLEAFSCIKVYHCADDPEASDGLSRPVAAHYDLCAISNVACLDMYRQWGCKRVMFWPLGSSFVDDEWQESNPNTSGRDVPVVFVGSMYGVPSMRIIGRALGLYKRRRFMERLERGIPELVAYGEGWRRGFLAEGGLAPLYRKSRVGINVHNGLGPVNFRLYDLPAFGILQICDNKETLGHVFRVDEEIVGFATPEECVELVRYYLGRPQQACEIAAAGHDRFRRDYATEPLWRTLLSAVPKL